MSGAEMHDNAAADPAKHTPLWVIGFVALLIAVGFLRRESGNATSRVGEHRQLKASRGRSAHTPSEIPALGWKDILLRVYRGISEDRILLIAAGVTFYTLLSVFPGIATLVSIYGLFAEPSTVADHVEAIANVAPGGAVEILRDQMTRLASQGGTTLGLGFLISLVISLWTAKSGITAIFDALNIVYEEREKRGFVRYYLQGLAFTAASVIFILLLIAAVVLLPVMLNYISLPGGTDLLLKIVRWPILFVLVALALAVLYRYGPSRAKPRWRWISWGSAFAAVGWLVASVLFSWYVANFGSFNKTYGSLGAIIGFMTWIWISIIVILVGAKLDAEMEHQTAHETTSDEPKPRGAGMADSIGPAQAS